MATNSIALFVRSLAKGGAEKQAILLHEYLQQYFNTYLIVYVSNSQKRYPTKTEENLIFLRGNPLRKFIQLYSILKKNKITHIFNYLPINNVFGSLIGKLAGVEYLYGGIRGTAYKSKMKMFLMKFLCNNISTAFISNSYIAANSYSNYGVNYNKIKVIHNAIPEVAFNKIDHSKITILSIGRFIEDKDYLTAICTISDLIENYPSIRDRINYKIIGYGKLENEIIEKIRSNHIDDICEIKVDGNTEKSYETADILLSTSVNEGMPNVVMEAMNHGLPIVATKAGDTEYLVKDCVNGFLCPTKDYKYIASKLYELIIDENLQNEMGRKGLQIIEENFRPEKVFRPYL